MGRTGEAIETAGAVLRTWGPWGLRRRAAYEVSKRSGLLRRTEAAWLQRDDTLGPWRDVDIVPPVADVGDEERDKAALLPIRLYGALEVSPGDPPEWHRHPVTGHLHDASAHWSDISDSRPETGDIKDVWELSRLGWLLPRVRRWGQGDEDQAESVWRIVEDWIEQNPPYRGPNWMCGQETSLRTTTVLFLFAALRSSPTATPQRQELVAQLVHHSVGRVVPTLGYALSQRNNHAISEAGFLWTATILLPTLPDAAALHRRAERALSEAVADQFATDGSYAQHSPTYQRVALHMLLWVLFVSRHTGVPAPAGVEDAVGRSVPFLRSLIAPGSEGRVPNLGGNDGALLFDLVPTDIGDFRPVIAHAAAATGQPSGFGPGPWDEEARWFGLDPVEGEPMPVAPTRSTHALTRGSAHAVVRAGPLAHRPAHADQLHTDVWLGGAPVAVDPGSHRYTAPHPWGNALAGDDVHNLPRHLDVPQAVRAGRFFWRRWAEASVIARKGDVGRKFLVARLILSTGEALYRAVGVCDGLVVVVDQAASSDVLVRWNLPVGVTTDLGPAATSVNGPVWSAVFVHGPGASVPDRSEDVPTSGWHAPTYGLLRPLTTLLLPVSSSGSIVSCFVETSRPQLDEASLHELANVDLSSTDVAPFEVALSRSFS